MFGDAVGDLFRFDLARLAWSRLLTSPSIAPVYGSQLSPMVHGASLRLLSSGGMTASGPTNRLLRIELAAGGDAARLHDFRAGGDSPPRVRDHGMAAASDGRVYVFGGSPEPGMPGSRVHAQYRSIASAMR